MESDGIRRTAALALVVFLVAVPTAASAAPFVDGAQVDPDNVLLRVSLHEDGSATWQVEYRVLLEDENATEAFESLEADIDANTSEYASRFGDRMRRTVASAENATGRDMDVRNVSVRTTRTSLFGPDREYGVVVYSFEWAGFAVVDGDRIEAGDAITGLFLDEQTRMILSWPTAYGLVQTSPGADETRENAVVWDGRLDFGGDEPRVVVSTAADDSPTTSVPGGSGPGDERDTPLAIVLLVSLGAVAALGVAGWLFVQRSGVGVGSAVAGDDDDGDDGDAGPPEDLLSNEERVLRLLEEHDGRMKQQQVASELDWTDAKTSQVVGDLRDDGDVEVFRLGRENVLTLPDEGGLEP